jgi:lambda family phage portal protein
MGKQKAAKAPKIKNSGYTEGGASLENNMLKGWRPKKLSAKTDILERLDLLRSRSADQSINSPIGAAAIQTSAMHAIGAGLRVFPRIKYKLLGMTPEQAREWSRKTAMEFDLWAGSKLCDIYKRNNFYDLQDIVYTGYLTDGDSFVAFRRKPYAQMMPYTLRLQVIEANRVSNPDSAPNSASGVEARLPNGNLVVGGVELDNDGATKAYWVSNKVPWDTSDSDQALEWTAVQAFGGNSGMPNILQICHDIRTGQTRGVPYLAPVISTLKQVSRYTESELAASIIRSFFALFFTQQDTAGGMTLNDIVPSSFDGDPNAPVVDVNEYSLALGTMNALPRGVDVKSIDASNAQSTFDLFVTQLIKQIGAAIGQPYEVLMKNFTSSYSASRAALLQAWEEYKLRRTWFARDFCQPVYEVWLTEAIATGRVQAPGFFTDPLIRKAWCNAEWFGPTMSILDPVKDVNGSNLRVYNGLSTHEKEAAEMTGTDLEENLEQLAYEKKLLEEMGLELMKPTGMAASEGGEANAEEVLENNESGGS